MTGPSPMDELRKAVADQKKANLPLEPEDPAMDEIHRAAVAYDQMVSQMVIGVIQGIKPLVTEQQVRQAQAALDRALDAPDSRNNRKAQVYRNYKERLDRMYALVTQIRSEGL